MMINNENTDKDAGDWGKNYHWFTIIEAGGFSWDQERIWIKLEAMGKIIKSEELPAVERAPQWERGQGKEDQSVKEKVGRSERSMKRREMQQARVWENPCIPWATLPFIWELLTVLRPLSGGTTPADPLGGDPAWTAAWENQGIELERQERPQSLLRKSPGSTLLSSNLCSAYI